MPFLPDVILLGQLPLATVALTGLAGGLLAYLLAGWLARREGAGPTPTQDLILNLLIGGVAGAKLVYVALDPLGHLRNPAMLLLFPYGTLALPAGLIGAIALAAFGLRREAGWKSVLDHAAAPLALGLAVAAAGWHAPGSAAFAPLLLAAGAAALATSLRPGQAPGKRAAQTLVFATAALTLADVARPGGAASVLQIGAALAGTGAWAWWHRAQGGTRGEAMKKDSGT